VPYVQVNWSQFAEVFYPFSDYGWDTHADNFELPADWHHPLLDQVLATLLDDLQDRGGASDRGNLGCDSCRSQTWQPSAFRPSCFVGQLVESGERRAPARR
jgi:hypothetical protein